VRKKTRAYQISCQENRLRVTKERQLLMKSKDEKERLEVSKLLKKEAITADLPKHGGLWRSAAEMEFHLDLMDVDEKYQAPFTLPQVPQT
jgi:hypothetical protein